MKDFKALVKMGVLAVFLLGAGGMNAQGTPAERHPTDSGGFPESHEALAQDVYAKKVKNTSFVSPSGERVLRQQVMVNATLEDVWKAVTTADGLESFMAPVVFVELKTGGRFESNYRIGSKLGDPGTIRNTVLNYVPMEMFSIKVNLTEGFPKGPREAGTLFAVLTFKDLGKKRVKVTESMLGWGTGQDWDKTYKFFDWGNAYTLGQLYRRFKEGPIRWSKE